MKIEELKKEIETKEKELLNLKEELKNINEYETIIIIDVETSIKKYDTMKKEIKEIFQNITTLEEMGTKKLAYEIKGNQEGFYLRYEWQGLAIDVAEFETYARNNDNIMKFITVKKSEEY